MSDRRDQHRAGRSRRRQYAVHPASGVAILEQLIPGVGIASFDGTRSPRVELSAGLLPATDAGYEPDAVVPRAPWRAPSTEEWEALAAPAGVSDADVVRVVALPSELAEQARELAQSFGREPTFAALRGLAASTGGRALDGALREHALAQHGVPGAVQEISGGICLRQRDLATVTSNSQTGDLVGLHLDDWYSLPLEARHRAPNRICANIGLGDRFFLFLNLPAIRLRALVLATPPEALARVPNGLATRESILGNVPGRVGGTAVARVFMALHPGYPVLRIRLSPGEAYIAATEHVVHDASSAGNACPDLTCSLRGYFTA